MMKKHYGIRYELRHVCTMCHKILTQQQVVSICGDSICPICGKAAIPFQAVCEVTYIKKFFFFWFEIGAEPHNLEHQIESSKIG